MQITIPATSTTPVSLDSLLTEAQKSIISKCKNIVFYNRDAINQVWISEENSDIYQWIMIWTWATYLGLSFEVRSTEFIDPKDYYLSCDAINNNFYIFPIR